MGQVFVVHTCLWGPKVSYWDLTCTYGDLNLFPIRGNTVGGSAVNFRTEVGITFMLGLGCGN